MILTPIEPLYFVGIRTGKLLAIEITYKILGSTATKPATRIDIHGHHPLHLLLITIYRQLEEVWALILTWLLSQALTEGTHVIPFLEIL